MVPKTGVPERDVSKYSGILGGGGGQLSALLEPGERILTIRTVRRGNRADIVFLIGSGNSMNELYVSANTPKDLWPTTHPETYTILGGSVGAESVAADDTEPFVLLRQRILGVPHRTSDSFAESISDPDVPLDGVLLWVVPAGK